MAKGLFKSLLRKEGIWPYAVIFLILLNGVLFTVFFSLSRTHPATAYPELHDLEGVVLSFKELAKYFTKLAEAKGAPYAFEVLRIAPIPPNTDMHLLGHIVGDILYRQQGAEGMRVCTQDFRNACSHSIVVGLFTEKGETALPQIVEACRQAPGQSGAYTMCFHGLGHGILAALDYDMPRAIEICKKTGRSELSQCISGMVMEIIGGGFHNKELWEKQHKKYLSDPNPLSLCQQDFMPSEARSMCFVYLTPHLFEAAGGSLASPTPKDFKKAFTLCDALPLPDTVNRNSCFGGFGKEFVVLAKNRDIRNIEYMTQEELGRIRTWCFLAPHEKGITACVEHAMQSLYWGGENDRDVAIRFCSLMSEDPYRSSCFENLIGAVSFYVKDPRYRKEFCGEIPADLHKTCREKLISSPASR
ncbi:MAG: hypothetical protein HY006_02395 [Candidatus Sungbacteria bacterium]|nr:hypothetical protein [Candidatus Sungbacteria bacterium]